MHRFALTALVAVALVGCGQDQTRAQATGAPGSFQAGGGFGSPFYAEEVFNGRLYLIGKKHDWTEFQKSHELAVAEQKTFIGKGPTVDGKRMTVIVQSLKDEPSVEKRLLETMRARWQVK